MRRALPAVLCLAAAAALSRPAPASGPLRLVVHERFGKPVRVDGCDSSGACAEWVRFPLRPWRGIDGVAFSRSRRSFYVWSKADGKPRDLDLFEVPRAGGPANRVLHLVPGVGGDLVWLEGERLWHWWGCGAPCVGAELIDASGVRYQEVGSAEGEARDGRRVAVTDWSGIVVLIDAALPARWRIGPLGGAGFPVGITFTPTSVRATFETPSGPRSTVVRDCVPAARGALACKDSP